MIADKFVDLYARNSGLRDKLVAEREARCLAIYSFEDPLTGRPLARMKDLVLHHYRRARSCVAIFPNLPAICGIETVGRAVKAREMDFAAADYGGSDR